MRFPGFLKGGHEKRMKKMARMESMKGWDAEMMERMHLNDSKQKKFSCGVGNHPIRSIKGHV